MGIPSQDGAAQTYFNSFASIIASDPGKYFISAADSAAISLAAANYSSAYLLATSAPTRNRLTVEQKDLMRVACEALVRLFSVQIKYNAGISSDDKTALGISPPNPTRAPRPVPATLPIINIVGSLLGSQTLRFIDPDTSRRAKPFGAQTVELRVAVGETMATDVNEAKPCGLFSRNPIGVAFDAADNKKIATYWGRWANMRGQAGPWSNPVSMAIAA